MVMRFQSGGESRKFVEKRVKIPRDNIYRQVGLKIGKIYNFDIPNYQESMGKLEEDTHAHARLHLCKITKAKYSDEEFTELSNEIEVIIFPKGCKERIGRCTGFPADRCKFKRLFSFVKDKVASVSKVYPATNGTKRPPKRANDGPGGITAEEIGNPSHQGTQMQEEKTKDIPEMLSNLSVNDSDGIHKESQYHHPCTQLQGQGNVDIPLNATRKEETGKNWPIFLSDRMPDIIDEVSKKLLEMTNPSLLFDVMPWKTIEDGNSLFRAASIAIRKDDSMHADLRQRVFQEMTNHPNWYNKDDPNFWSPFGNDNEIMLENYSYYLTNTPKSNEPCDMNHILALSAVLNQPIEVYYPPIKDIVNAYSRVLKGRGVKEPNDPDTKIKIMWTTTELPSQITEFKPNHFVPLRKINQMF